MYSVQRLGLCYVQSTEFRDVLCISVQFQGCLMHRGWEGGSGRILNTNSALCVEFKDVLCKEYRV